MEKIKDFFHKTNKKVLPLSIIFFVIVFTLHFVLKAFNLKFRKWVYLIATTILTIAISILIIEIFIKQSKKIKLVIGNICAILAILCIIFCKKIIPILFLSLLIINPKSEHVVKRQGNKYVAEVETVLSHTTVSFYKYVNCFMMGSEVEFEEIYKGAYNPIKKER